MAKRIEVVAALVATVVLGACTTTAREAASDSAFENQATESTVAVGAPAEGSVTTAAPVTTAPAGADVTTTVAVTRASAGSPVGAAASAAPTGCGTGRLGQGVTADTIKLGFIYSSDVGTANRSLGGDSWREGEPRSFGEALVRHYNKHGGLCGRKIVPVWADEKVVTGASPDSSDQAACTTWTQDNGIFAAMSFGSFRPNRLECLARAGVMAIDTGSLLLTDDDDLRRYFSLLYKPYSLSLDRFFPVYVEQLAANGYFVPGARVGLLYTDIPAEERAIKRSLLPALKAKGIELVEQARVTHTWGIDSLAAAQTETNSVVLRFQTSRVSHVLAPIDGFSFGIFVGRAEQQRYRPRYALSSSTQANARGGGGQHAQLEGALRLSWLPAVDWNEAKANPGTKACLDMLAQEGHPEPRDGGVMNLSYCGFLDFLRLTLSKARDVTPAGVHAAAASLGRQPGDLAWAWRLTGARHDGVDAVRMAAYSGGEKGSWRYVSPLVAVS